MSDSETSDEYLSLPNTADRNQPSTSGASGTDQPSTSGQQQQSSSQETPRIPRQRYVAPPTDRETRSTTAARRLQEELERLRNQAGPSSGASASSPKSSPRVPLSSRTYGFGETPQREFPTFISPSVPTVRNKPPTDSPSFLSPNLQTFSSSSSETHVTGEDESGTESDSGSSTEVESDTQSSDSDLEQDQDNQNFYDYYQHFEQAYANMQQQPHGAGVNGAPLQDNQVGQIGRA